jgi:hypothetical protein
VAEFPSSWRREGLDEVDRRIVGLGLPSRERAPAIRLAIVRYHSGYRREWLFNQDILREMCSWRGQFADMSIADTEHGV